MLKNVDLSREVAKAEYKRLKGDADLKSKTEGAQRQEYDQYPLVLLVVLAKNGWIIFSTSGFTLFCPVGPNWSVTTSPVRKNSCSLEL
jgi:hypothetical protein